jgi:hypothetical protein
MKKIGIILMMTPTILLLGSSALLAQSKEEAEREKVRQFREQAKAEAEFRSREEARVSSGTYVVPSSGGNEFFFFNQGGSTSSQLSLSKSFEGESTNNSGSFEVDNNVNHINLNLNGSVKSGKIKITVLLPDGDILKDVTIDESADIQYNQSIRISDEQKKYYGNWTYIIESVKATGRYRFMIQSR